MTYHPRRSEIVALRASYCEIFGTQGPRSPIRAHLAAAPSLRKPAPSEL